MISPPISPPLSVKRLRLTIQFEWMVALAITAVVLWLDISYARHAGGLWRDEVNSISMATYPSLSTTWDRLQFDSFPMLWYVVLREWVRAGLGQTDLGFRIFGLVVNGGILAILWLNGWRMSRRPPLVALTLLGANAAVMVYCGSIRGYGLGLALGLWMYGAVWAYLMRPTAMRWTAALVAALLACHTLYYNCVFVGAACLAGAGVAVSRRRWRVAASVMAVGAVTAATLLIYLPTFRASGEWRRMYVYDGGFTGLWLKFAEAVTLGHQAMLPIWAMVLLLAPLGAFITWSRIRNAVLTHGVDQTSVSGQPDLALFAAISLSLGLIGNILFLRLLNYYMQPWYFLCLMAVVAAGADAAQRAASIGKGFRIFGVALVAVALMLISFSPLQMWSMTRRTNLDEVAHVVEQSATKRDYIVVTDWVQGITFHRYYGGSTPWQTLPALPADAHEIHRSDLVSKLMHRSDAISPVLDSVAQTLRDGHRVFYIGHLPEQLPSENPYIYFGKRVEQHLQPLPLEVWRYELDYTLHELASYVTHIPINLKQPISSFEDLELSVFEGRRPSTIQSTAN
jgi:hypothetical protein